MPGQQNGSLQQRVERLESAVEAIQRSLHRPPETSAQPQISKAPARPPNARLAPAAKRRLKNSEIMGKSESWLKVVGIGLLLLGVGFLFKFSIDQGWITETVRVGFALVVGIALFITGLRIDESRRAFSQVLLGGSVATFYIAGFAAFQLYALVSHSTALGYMVSVTALAFFLSLRQHEPILSIIGAVGGLGTPFLLHTGAGNLAGLVGYTCLVLCGTSTIYMYRGWRSLLWTSIVGGWAVLLIGQIQGDIHLIITVGLSRRESYSPGSHSGHCRWCVKYSGKEIPRDGHALRSMASIEVSGISQPVTCTRCRFRPR